MKRLLVVILFFCILIVLLSSYIIKKQEVTDPNEIFADKLLREGASYVPPKPSLEIIDSKLLEEQEKARKIWQKSLEERIAYAQEKGFIYNVQHINNTILKNQSAVFILTITNGANQDNYFTINTSKENWNLTYEPSSGFVPFNNETKFIVRLKPNESVLEDRTYFFTVNIYANNSDYLAIIEERFAVYVICPTCRFFVD